MIKPSRFTSLLLVWLFAANTSFIMANSDHDQEGAALNQTVTATEETTE